MVKNSFRDHGDFVDNDKIVARNIPVYGWRLITFHWDMKCCMNSVTSDLIIYEIPIDRWQKGAATRIFVFVGTSSLTVQSIVYVFPAPGLPVRRIGFVQQLLVA